MINYANNCFFGCQGNGNASTYSAGTPCNNNNFFFKIQMDKKKFSLKLL